MSIRQLLDQYNIRPRKSYGQNFLLDQAALSKIISAAELTPEDQILEVGPGLGVLTRELAKQAKRVVAVELDPHMIQVLEQELLADLDNVELVAEDILQANIGQLMCHDQDQAYKVVANLPYNITSAALRHLLESHPQPKLLVVMVQKEVAQRMTASPGQMSLLAISVQLYGTPRLVSIVPAGSFYPRPKVDSAIVRIDIHPEPLIPVSDTRSFFTLARAGFAQRRKQLHNALVHGLHKPSAMVEQALRQSDIDPKRRAQTLSMAEWIRLQRVFANLPKE